MDSLKFVFKLTFRLFKKTLKTKIYKILHHYIRSDNQLSVCLFCFQLLTLWNSISIQTIGQPFIVMSLFAACRTIQTERFEIVNQTESSETVLLPILLLYDASKCIQKTSFAFESWACWNFFVKINHKIYLKLFWSTYCLKKTLKTKCEFF